MKSTFNVTIEELGGVPQEVLSELRNVSGDGHMK
jgi:hypothetical protein